MSKKKTKNTSDINPGFTYLKNSQSAEVFSYVLHKILYLDI